MGAMCLVEWLRRRQLLDLDPVGHWKSHLRLLFMGRLDGYGVYLGRGNLVDVDMLYGMVLNFGEQGWFVICTLCVTSYSVDSAPIVFPSELLHPVELHIHSTSHCPPYSPRTLQNPSHFQAGQAILSQQVIPA